MKAEFVRAIYGVADRLGVRDDLNAFMESGGELVDKETKDRRMEICRGCDRMVGSGDEAQCSNCGCFLNLKTAMKSHILAGLGRRPVRCPLDKW